MHHIVSKRNSGGGRKPCYSDLPMAQKHPRSAGITNAVLLQHLQGMRSALEGRMGNMEGGMNGIQGHMDSLDLRMTKGFTEMSDRFKRVDDALQRLYTHRVNMLERIDRLEEAVGIG